jgi:hypothetical protein
MTNPSFTRLLWVVAALLGLLIATVSLFEQQQALRQPVLFGNADESR